MEFTIPVLISIVSTIIGSLIVFFTYLYRMRSNKSDCQTAKELENIKKEWKNEMTILTEELSKLKTQIAVLEVSGTSGSKEMEDLKNDIDKLEKKIEKLLDMVLKFISE